MNETGKQLLILLRRALFQSAEPLPGQADWSALLQEAKLHAVIPIAFAALKEEERAAMPQDLLTLWRQMAFKVVYQNERLQQEQKAVLTALEQADIPCAILKGSSVAIRYPNPILRAMGDIDILVHPQQQLETVKVLQDMGYSGPHGEQSPCHLEVSRDAFSVEVHKEPNGLFICENGALKQKFYDFFAAGLKNRHVEDGIPLLPDEQQAVVLLLHKLGHFMHTGLGLRQLCDWAMFVASRLTADRWGRLEPLLQEFGLLAFAQFVTKTCQLYLGLPEETAPWTAQNGTQLPQSLMEEIMKAGNFGAKGRVADQTIFTDVHANSPMHSFFRMILRSTKLHFPACEKYPALLVLGVPAAAVRFAWLRLTGKRKTINFTKAYKNAGEQQRLYHELKPFMTGDESHEK